MTATPPVRVPSRLIQGDRWRFTRLLSDYLPAEYTAVFHLVSATVAQTIAGTDNGDGQHLFSLAAATTAGIAAADYHWFIRCTAIADALDITTVERGVVTVARNPASAAEFRSQVKTTLDAINTLLAGKYLADAASYAIEGRSLTKMTTEELIAAQYRYAELWRRELAAMRAEAGQPKRNKLLVRFR